MSRTLRVPIHRRRDGGMTLVEMSIAVAISLIASVAILSMFIAASKMSVESYLRNKAAMEARSVIDHLTSDARAAVELESAFGKFTAGPTTLILKVPALDAKGVPVDIESKFDRIVYHQGGGDSEQLVRTVVADASSTRKDESYVIGKGENPDISISGTYSAQPDALGAYVIHYQFTAVQTHGDKQYLKPVAGSVRLRNRV